MENNTIAAVIFDMDGVLVDSEPFICKAACMMFEERGVSVQPEDFEEFVGMGEDRYISGVAQKYNHDCDIAEVKKRTYDIYDEIIVGNLKPLPGVFDFIKKCKEMGMKLAVASSADLRKVKHNLEEIDLPLTTFDSVVCGDDIEHKKPAPDIFLLAAKRIGITPENCLVVEDAVTGVEAAKTAGAKCLAITSSFTEDQLSKADYFAKDLATAPENMF